jgi:O-antigen/teichoic acid export membrane protein
MEKAANGLITILLIPIIIKSVGIENYGLWGILCGILSYFQCCDLGISFSLERFVAFHEAKSDRSAIQVIITTSFTYLLLFCIVVLIIIAGFGKQIMHVLIKNDTGIDTSNLLLAAFPALAATVLQSVYMSIPRGFQKFDLSSKIQIAGKIVFAVSLILLFAAHKSIYALIISLTIQSYFTLISYCICVKKITPGIHLFKLGISVPTFRQLLNFGLKIQVSSIAFLITQHFDKMLLSSFFGLMYAGYYEVATKIVYAVRDIPLFLMSVLTPRISELVSLGNHDSISALYQKVTGQLAIISFFLMILLYFNRTILLTALLKTTPPQFTQYVFSIMCVACFWHVISGGATYISRGMGCTSVEMKATLVTLLLNVTLSPLFMRFFGINGVVFGTATALIISPFVCYYIVNKLFSLKMLPFLRTTFLTSTLYGIIMLSLFYVTAPLIHHLHRSIWAVVPLSFLILCATHIYYRLMGDTVYDGLIGMLPYARKRKLPPDETALP